MLGTVCPPCQVEQGRCSGKAHWHELTRLADIVYADLSEEEELRAMAEIALERKEVELRENRRMAELADQFYQSKK